MLLSTHAYKAFSSTEKYHIQNSSSNFLQKPTDNNHLLQSSYNVTEEAETETFYDKLSSITRQSPKRNVLVIGGDFNAYLGQDNGHKFAYHH